MNRVDLQYARVHYEAPIVYIQFKDRAEIGYFEVQEMIKTAEQLSGYKPYVVLADSRKSVSVTPEGRRLSISSTAAPLHYGTAVLVPDKLVQAATFLFGKFAKIPFPYKAFTEQQKAESWLRSLDHTGEINPFFRRA
jgi:hypothetical protein